MIKKGVINTNGEWVVRPGEYDDIRYASEGKMAALDPETGGWGYIDINGGPWIEFEFDDARPFSDGLGVVATNFGGLRFGAIDHDGNVAIDLIYPVLHPFRNAET